MHAYFVQAGVPGEGMDLTVDRVRDGCSMSTRQVTVVQGERTLLVAIVSFHANPASPERAGPPPSTPPPDELPVLQDWLRDLPPDLARHGMAWVEQPPPLALRIGEAPTFLGGQPAEGTRSHWMRLPRAVGDDPRAPHRAAGVRERLPLARHGVPRLPGRARARSSSAFSLDHAIWFHRPVRFDQWHLHTQETLAIAGHRGLVRGAVHDADGLLVASVVQEVLVRPALP